MPISITIILVLLLIIIPSYGILARNILKASKGSLHPLHLGNWFSSFLASKPSNTDELMELRRKLEARESSALEAIFRRLLNDIDNSSKVASAINIERDLQGCWEVASIDGLPSWQKYSKFLTTFSKSKRNRNFQYFSDGESFVNLSEYLGSNFYAYTNGTYKIICPTSREIVANVASVIIVLYSFRWKINVNGKGLVNVLYSDGIKRVLQSEEGAKVLQIKAEIPLEYSEIMN